MLKIGIFGARRGNAFMNTLRFMKNAEFVALCEKDEEALKEAKSYLTENVKIYEDYDEFINSGLDGVILCNYFHEHAEYAIKAFKAGVAVLSETTAAPTLGDCVRLVEKCEEYNGVYMLAANCPYFNALHSMKKRIDDNKTGSILYGEAEYLHDPFEGMEKPVPARKIDMNNLHWRQMLPPNAYNMHTLGPLMYVTNSMPLTVSCKMIRNSAMAKHYGNVTDCVGAVVITEMSNGAVFQTTGHNAYGPTSKWYRLACENETLETKRFDSRETRLLVTKDMQHTEDIWDSEKQCGLIGPNDEIDKNDVNASGHGGIDYYVTYHFIKVLEKKEQPFFDVYRSAALSAVGILGWYSALTDSRELRIPDFKVKEERDRIRNDFRSPFVERDDKWWIPCRLDEKDKFVLDITERN